MFSTFFPLGLALLPFVSATVHDIQVGAGGMLQYTPEAISAQPGDQVVFHFNPKNHTVSQSSFANPCGLKDGGFDSGFMPVAANQTSPTYTITVNDTQPIWVYCRQKTPTPHCGAGMVFAVNCGQDGSPNSFTNFKNSALAVGASLSAAAATASATVDSGSSATWTAAYGGYTIPPPAEASVVTQTITVEASTWTTVYSSYPGSPAPTPASLQGQVHKVIVGGSGGVLMFDPPHIAAQPRDIVVFEFHQKNHTVTQSSFADPCRKLNANGTTGFDAGFMPVADDATTFPTWNLTVNDTQPIWAYCRQQVPASHCGSGMVFAVNSVESGPHNFTAFQNVAKAINGTAAAATEPSASASQPPISASSQPASAASSIRVGGLGLGLTIIAMVATLL